MSYTIIPRAIDLQSLPDEQTITLNNNEKLEIKNATNDALYVDFLMEKLKLNITTNI